MGCHRWADFISYFSFSLSIFILEDNYNIVLASVTDQHELVIGIHMSPPCVVHMSMWYFLRYLVHPTCARSLLLVPHSLVSVYTSSHRWGYLNLLVKWARQKHCIVLTYCGGSCKNSNTLCKASWVLCSLPSYCQGD